MEHNEYTRLATYEAGHWWFVGKRQLVQQCIAQYSPPPERNRTILDAGCGTGAILGQHCTVSPIAFGFDKSPIALDYAKKAHRGRLGQAGILAIPVADNSLDLVTCLDVLYHQWVTDDEIALAEIYRVLKPGGILIVTNPAFSFLAGPHDAVNFTARRYSLPQLAQKLSGVGFKIEKKSYAYALLFPVVLLRRWFQRTFAKSKPSTSDIQFNPPVLNQLLLRLYQLELAWLRFGSFPWGTSVYFVAKK